MGRLIVLAIACLLAILPISAQTLSEAEVTATMNRAFELHKAQRYAEALDAFLVVGANVDANKSEVERQVYVCSQTMACTCYRLIGRYGEGYRLAKKLIAQNKLTERSEKNVYSVYLSNGQEFAKFLIDSQKDFDRAREILHELNLVKRIDGLHLLQDNIQFRIYQSWLKEGELYYCAEKFDEALKCYKIALEGFRKLDNIDIKHYERLILPEMGHIYASLEQYQKAIPYLEQALSLISKPSEEILNHELFKNNPSIRNAHEAKQMMLLIYIKNVYLKLGDTMHALKYSNKMEELNGKTENITAKCEYAIAKGEEAAQQDEYQVAEQWFMQAMELAHKKSKEIKDHYLPSKVYIALRDLHSGQGNYEAALEFAKELIKGQECNEDNYFDYIFLADIYRKKEDFESSYNCIQQLFRFEDRIDEPRMLYKLYSCRASYYLYSGKPELAFRDYKKADEILAAKYPVNDSERIDLYPLIGATAHRLGKSLECEYYYKLYADAQKELQRDGSLAHIKAQVWLANTQALAGHIAEGCLSYARAIDNLKALLKAQLPFVKSGEREGYWSEMSNLLAPMTSFALAGKQFNSEFTASCYNSLLMSKGFLLDSERSMGDIIRKEGNELDKARYDSINKLNSKIKVLKKENAGNDSIRIALNSVSRLEGLLMAECTALKKITAFLDVDYNKVKSSLGEREVLIDFTDFFSQEAGKHLYAAYIINKKQQYPHLKQIFDDVEIKNLGINHPSFYYDAYYSEKILKILWEPLEEFVNKGDTIYYVPSQLLFQVCLESLPLKDGTLLGDHYNFVRLSSAREITKRQGTGHLTTNNASAVLYGGLQYDVGVDAMSKNAKRYDISSVPISRGDTLARGEAKRELIYSKKEITQIGKILKQNKFRVTPYSDDKGSAESLLSLHGNAPQVLHLATHGFYFTPDQAKKVAYLDGYQDAMSLSGLIMSGGNAGWTNKKLPKGVSGGVLTANQIACLDLSNTEMAVLSACQSGQGKATEEGLYGLQRAFKKAGVGTMVMTLWNVADDIAAEFMIKFYEYLASEECKWDKHKAFNKAKSDMYKSYKDKPEHWAVFMMLD